MAIQSFMSFTKLNSSPTRAATFCGLAGVTVEDAWAAASSLPPVDSLDVWPLVAGMNSTSPRVDILVNANLLVSGEWKYVRPNTSMIEASWGGVAYPNGSSIEASNWVASYNLHCGMNGCLFNGVVLHKHPGYQRITRSC